MSFVLNTPEQREEMLLAIGVGSIDELLAKQIPAEVLFDQPLDRPPALGEIELESRTRQLATLNRTDRVCLMGAGRMTISSRLWSTRSPL